ncbi:hypothetical protein ACFV6I_27785, partial [Kitasatospora sp. NPDC059803]
MTRILRQLWTHAGRAAAVVALLAAALTGTAAGTATAATPAAPAATASVGGWTCPGTPVPDGYVITMFNSRGCNNHGAWFQAPAQNR